MKIFQDYCDDIIEFFGENGLVFDRVPGIRIEHGFQSRFDPFASTGHYDFTKNEITLHVSNRHCKDILRTFCHELVHAHQYQTDPDAFESLNKAGSLAENDDLRRYEEDAFRRGNLLFRDWTEARKPDEAD